MRVLIVEDNHRLAEVLKDNLSKSYVVDIVHEGKQALSEIDFNQYSMIILDLGLPDISGLDVCKEIRKKKINTPILILTAINSTQNKVELLNAGADDYLTKPFDSSELNARLQALLRRTGDNADPILRVKDIELNPLTRKVFRNNKNIDLRRKEFDLLEYFMRNTGRVLTRGMIINQVWNSESNSWNNSVEVHINHLRSKIQKPFGDTDLISTVHGVGYKLNVTQDNQSRKEKTHG